MVGTFRCTSNIPLNMVVLNGFTIGSAVLFAEAECSKQTNVRARLVRRASVNSVFVLDEMDEAFCLLTTGCWVDV